MAPTPSISPDSTDHAARLLAAEELLSTLQLTLTPGLGPVLTRRLTDAFGTATRARNASAGALQTIEGIGKSKADSIARAIPLAAEAAQRELEICHASGITIFSRTTPGYPTLLSQLPDAPPLLFCKGALPQEPVSPTNPGNPSIAIVGSRDCSAYGIDQAARLSALLTQAGLTIVSGGARGIDTAAHRSAVQVKGRTLVVMGCGLGHVYPPENEALFQQIVNEGLGAIISEFPFSTAPVPENFPKRNRIISGLSLGVLVIEAAARSGALITARIAADHGREVMAIPGRVDSPYSIGSNDLIKSGGAHFVSDANDILSILESPARRVSNPPTAQPNHQTSPLFQNQPPTPAVAPPAPKQPSTPDHPILLALSEPRTIDQLLECTGLPIHQLRSQLTLLEMQRRVVREGSRFRRP